ncbi:FAD:protein FMN transferase [soil metagenome]
MIDEVPEGLRFRFTAMASPCEIRVETRDQALAARLGEMAAGEAERIEAKFSRYRPTSLLSQINASGGAAVAIDAETAALLAYAHECHAISGGRFDITSGVLRRLWRFDGSDRVPSRAEVRALLPLVGWDKVVWDHAADGGSIVLPPGMEIDFGGIAKEYAVDRVAMLLAALRPPALLVNFGGDLKVTGPRLMGQPWRVALESVDAIGDAVGFLEISGGGLTTSGDARRAIVRDGKRYSHILDPRTGWPVVDPPRSVTVAAASCLEAGILSTLAMLHGRQAERFLKRENVRAWWVR